MQKLLHNKDCCIINPFLHTQTYAQHSTESRELRGILQRSSFVHSNRGCRRGSEHWVRVDMPLNKLV
jgi:hypothetical protein